MEVLAAQAPEANRLDALRLAMMASTDRTLTISTLPGALSPALYRVGGDPEQLTPSGLTRALVAIHGAGGSENMFHDAYGLGRLAEWCRQHNRLLIAPRIYSPRDEFWSRLEPLLSQASTTPSLVLVGHSMGSLSSIEMARQRPDLLAGVVAISVGSVQNMEALKGLPVLVAAGQRDFGRHSSRVLYTRLRMAGAKVQWLETPSEHLMVVADALPKAIEWIGKLPGASTKPQPRPRTTSQYR
jgi:pimeloyl-ACP methyl ester carboxylesterase